MDWQSIAVVYTHRKSGVPGPIYRQAAVQAGGLLSWVLGAAWPWTCLMGAVCPSTEGARRRLALQHVVAARLHGPLSGAALRCNPFPLCVPAGS